MRWRCQDCQDARRAAPLGSQWSNHRTLSPTFRPVHWRRRRASLTIRLSRRACIPVDDDRTSGVSYAKKWDAGQVESVTMRPRHECRRCGRDGKYVPDQSHYRSPSGKLTGIRQHEKASTSQDICSLLRRAPIGFPIPEQDAPGTFSSADPQRRGIISIADLFCDERLQRGPILAIGHPRPT